MDDSSGTTEALSACARDGVQTRLRCTECQAPICPDCYVRTPVGLRCPDCSAASGPPVREVEEARRRWAVPVAVAAVVAVGLVVAALAGGGRGGAPALDLGEGGPSSRRGVPVGAPPLGPAMGDRRGSGAAPVTAHTVSERLTRRVLRDFAAGDAERVLEALAALPEPYSALREQIQAAIVLRADGDWHRFQETLRMAHFDWRDVIVAAGLAHEDRPDRMDLD